MTTSVNNSIYLPPVLFPPVSYFASAWNKRMAGIELPVYWNKRDKKTHRFAIADVNGEIKLTVPVEKPESFTRTPFDSVRISSHGEWWHVHRVTLESAYGRTPYFEHYFPHLEQFFQKETVERYSFLWEYILATTQTLGKLLQLDTSFAVTNTRETTIVEVFDCPPYWQIRMNRFGFIPSLSALDLLFNLGPESILYLQKLNQQT